MKTAILVLLLINTYHPSYSQNLTREETITYINSKLSSYDGMVERSNYTTSSGKSTFNYKHIASQKLSFENSTNTYSLEITSYDSNEEFGRFNTSIQFSNIKMNSITEFIINQPSNKQYETNPSSPLIAINIHIKENSINRKTLRDQNVDRAAGFWIYYPTNDTDSQRLINAFKHLAELDKKEQKKEPFDN